MKKQAQFNTIIQDLPYSPMIFFELCGVVCMISSAVMHLFWVKSKEICEKVHKLDLTGILLLILGSSLCMIYYQYMCLPFYKNLYMIINSLIACCVLYVMLCGGHFVSLFNFQV
jgi:predicted membrane channel-forming protein YqfA (hemolysin III family)